MGDNGIVTESFSTLEPPTFEVPQSDLRFVERFVVEHEDRVGQIGRHVRILQQKWLLVRGDRQVTEWRDVPLVAE